MNALEAMGFTPDECEKIVEVGSTFLPFAGPVELGEAILASFSLYDNWGIKAGDVQARIDALRGGTNE